MKPKLKELISADAIQKRVRELGEQITRDYKGETVTCVGVLKGSVLFFSDLIRQIDLPIHVDFLGASSYGQRTSSSGIVQITLDLSLPITGKHVLLIEDVIDTGLTLHYLLENLRLKNPASLKLCALLLKPEKLQKKISVDYLGFTIEDHFVVGYGLDAMELHRNLPYLAIYPAGEEKPS